MLVFEWIVILLAGAVCLAALARRIGAPYPALLAVGGALLALAPGGLRLSLDPSLALALFVAPVLLDAAYDASLRDLRDNWGALTSLIIVAVCLTTAAVACVAHALRPELTLSAAIVLGAIVAPPDAAAATAVLRQVRPPHRLMVILEGESLLNDAVALLVYRLGVAAAMGTQASPGRAVPLVVVTVAGSLGAGFVLAELVHRLIGRVTDIPSNIVLQFVLTFGVWLLAEHVGLSGVLTIVAYAVTLARSAHMPARLRVPAFAVWDTVVFVLNVLAFVLIGLQIRPILERSSPAQRVHDFTFAGLVLVTVIVVRILWVVGYDVVTRWKIRHFGAKRRRPMPPPTAAGGVVIAWCGMRGIVTLAAALALPAGFPQRDLIVLTAFAVVVGTLLVQGLTLRPLLARLQLTDDHPVERDVQRAWTHALKAALASLDGEATTEAASLRREYATALAGVRAEAAEATRLPPPLPSDALRRRSITAARQCVAGLRAQGDIGDDAFHTIEEELDRLELAVDR
jgi:Na+/H+ antiporter